MIVGYILIGAVAGLLTFVAALVFGASFWLALGLYTLIGLVSVILLPVARIIVGILIDRREAPATSINSNDTRNPHFAELSGSQQGEAIGSSMRILAVDDDPFILELIPTISAKAGFSEVTAAASGEQALRLLADTDMVFDCLMFDIDMPGMDGIELCRCVRQIPQYVQTPIVMLTAKRDMANMGDAYRAGATDYATKPFDIEELGTRLRVAQKAIHARRDPSHAKQEGTGYHWSPVPAYGFKLPAELRSENVRSLVDHTILSNYLTHLPRAKLTDIQVFAVSIDGIEAVQMRSSRQEFVSLFEDLAAAAADCLGVDQTVMAYTDNATLLIAVNSSNPLPAIIIEKNIERRLKGNVSESGTRVGVSVGGPIQPRGTKAERARMATDHVIALAENRAVDKHGRPVAGLFKR